MIGLKFPLSAILLPAGKSKCNPVVTLLVNALVMPQVAIVKVIVVKPLPVGVIVATAPTPELGDTAPLEACHVTVAPIGISIRLTD